MTQYICLTKFPLKKVNIIYTFKLFPVYANYIDPSVMTDANCEGFPIRDERITENDRCVSVQSYQNIDVLICVRFSNI